MTSIRKYFQDESGVAAVEFALIAPIFLVILMGTIDFGFFIMERMQIQNTAHAVAEYVAQTQDNANVEFVAEEVYSGDYEDISVVSVFMCECADGVAYECPIDCPTNDYQRRFIEVSVSGTFQPVLVHPAIFTGGAAEIQREVRMRVD